ncbi:CPBP family intramembrane glutamic endopeptidase [Enterobacteriaceae bacterium C23F]
MFHFDNMRARFSGGHDFAHGFITSVYFIVVFILSFAITSLPLFIINYTKLSLNDAIYLMCVVELTLAVATYGLFLHRLSEFKFSRFSLRQYTYLLITIVTLQFTCIMLSLGLNKPAVITLDFLSVITLVFIIPVYEEIFYRGCLFGFFCSLFKKGIVTPAILTSFVFSFMHMQFTSGLEYILMFTVGLILAYARIITKGLLLPIALHSTMNAFALTYNYLSS